MKTIDQDLKSRRLKDLALKARYSGEPVFTRFLEPPEEIPARTVANSSDVYIHFFGGYSDAERRIAAFSIDADPPETFPIIPIAIRWNSKYSSPGHRDILGAMMGLGIERDTFGDLVFSSESGLAYAFVTEDMEQYIEASLESAGRAGVKCERASTPLLLREPEGVTLRLTVAAERLDAIIAAALKISRNDAQKMIEAGNVRRNHIPEIRTDIHLEENDLLSVRGYGRMRVLSFDENLTRKGRRVVRLFQYK